MASPVDIANLALQKLGAGSIVSLDEDSPVARAINLSYPIILKSELRAHPWNFSIQRFQLPESTSTPLFGKSHAYPLPAGFLRLLPPEAWMNFAEFDWQIENGSILSDDTAPLEIRAVCDVDDSETFDANFVLAFATAIALHHCEEFTQSNTKKDALAADYKQTISTAKKTNAIENIAQDPPEDTFLSCRR